MLHHYFFSTVGWLHPIIARHRCAREDELELVKCTKKSKETCQASTCENVSEKLSVNGGFWVRIFLRKSNSIRTRTPSYLHTFCKFLSETKIWQISSKNNHIFFGQLSKVHLLEIAYVM